ncbi:MAG: pseudouridine synthase [Anaerolineales bacterium]|nr:pseudouridine synthase [Anaerolineales bacterium]
MTTTIRFYKPYGVLTKFTDAEERPTLADYIHLPAIYPAGRLDLDSEGLLILTDHNALKTRLTEPRYAHPRTYWAQVEHIPDEQALQQLREGVVIQDYTTRPAQVSLIDEPADLPPRDPPIRYRKSTPTAFVQITLTEGRNRQVRRMTAAVGHPTLRLIRVAVGPITLESLSPGEWQPLTPTQQRDLLKSVGLIK